MAGHQTLLATLLESKGLHRYGAFCIAYEKAGRSLDGKPGTPPSRAQFHRWLVGDMRSVPYTDHCRVLEHMVTGYTASQLDDHACVAQPYLPTARGVQSPTLLIRRTPVDGGLYSVFDRVFEALSKRSSQL